MTVWNHPSYLDLDPKNLPNLGFRQLVLVPIYEECNFPIKAVVHILSHVNMSLGCHMRARSQLPSLPSPPIASQGTIRRLSMLSVLSSLLLHLLVPDGLSGYSL